MRLLLALRKLGLIALVVFLPLTGIAQQRMPTPPIRPVPTLLGLSTDQALAIGVGVLGGAFGLHALLGSAAWTLAGGVAGALVADMWYVQGVGAHKGTATMAAR